MKPLRTLIFVIIVIAFSRCAVAQYPNGFELLCPAGAGGAAFPLPGSTTFDPVTNQSRVIICVDPLGNVTSPVFGVVGSGVTSFKGRTGAVVPALNDYSFSLISGTLSTTQVPTGGSATNFLNGAGTYTVPSGVVSSVFGRTGAVVAATNDYAFNQISGTWAASQAFAGGSSTAFLNGSGTYTVPTGTGVASLFGTTGTITSATIFGSAVIITDPLGAFVDFESNTSGSGFTLQSGTGNDSIQSDFPAGGNMFIGWGTLQNSSMTFTSTGITFSGPGGTLVGYAPLNSPALTGNPTAPTQAAHNSSTRLSTTAFVETEFASPPTTGYGSTTPEPVAATTLSASGAVSGAGFSGFTKTINYWAPSWDAANGSTGNFGGSSNNETLWGQNIDTTLSFGHIVVDVTTLDAVGIYSFGIYNSSGTAVCTTTAQTLPATGVLSLACSQGTVSAPTGKYFFGATYNAVGAAAFATMNAILTYYGRNNTFVATSGGNQPASITPPSDNIVYNGGGVPLFLLTP